MQLQVASVNLPYEEPKPIQHSVQVEGFVNKPMITTTKVTIEVPKKTPYRPLQGSVTIVGVSYEQCVVYARRITGNQKIRGWAGALRAEGSTAQVGAIALESGHVSIVKEVNGNTVLVEESNFRSGYITQRSISVTSLLGFIY